MTHPKPKTTNPKLNISPAGRGPGDKVSGKLKVPPSISIGQFQNPSTRTQNVVDHDQEQQSKDKHVVVTIKKAWWL